MKRRTRYLLLAIGFIIFLIVAPLIVLYVGGISYDFKTRDYVRTGIIVADTEPKDADVYLNGVLKDSTPARIKFLKSGEYTVTLQKDGYQSWSKRLEVKSNKVTWTTSDTEHVFLLKANPEQNVVASSVIDAAVSGGQIVYLTSTSLVTAPLDNLNDTHNITLPAPAEHVTLSSNGRLALVSGQDRTFVFDFSNNSFQEITTLITRDTELQLSDNNTLYGLHNGSLETIDWKAQRTTVVATNIASFTTREDALYYLRSNATNLELVTIPRNGDLIRDQQILFTSIPRFSQSRLLVTKGKEVFILADNAVYKVNSDLKRLASNITSWDYNSELNSLLFIGPSELDFYNFNSGNSTLITRTTTPLQAPQLEAKLGYIFYGQDGWLQALELDNRDHQNNFRLAPGASVQKILSSNEARILYVLDNNTLIKLAIR